MVIHAMKKEVFPQGRSPKQRDSIPGSRDGVPVIIAKPLIPSG